MNDTRTARRQHKPAVNPNSEPPPAPTVTYDHDAWAQAMNAHRPDHLGLPFTDAERRIALQWQYRADPETGEVPDDVTPLKIQRELKPGAKGDPTHERAVRAKLVRYWMAEYVKRPGQKRPRMVFRGEADWYRSGDRTDTVRTLPEIQERVPTGYDQAYLWGVGSSTTTTHRRPRPKRTYTVRSTPVPAPERTDTVRCSVPIPAPRTASVRPLAERGLPRELLAEIEQTCPQADVEKHLLAVDQFIGRMARSKPPRRIDDLDAVYRSAFALNGKGKPRWFPKRSVEAVAPGPNHHQQQQLARSADDERRMVQTFQQTQLQLFQMPEPEFKDLLGRVCEFDRERLMAEIVLKSSLQAVVEDLRARGVDPRNDRRVVAACAEFLGQVDPASPYPPPGNPPPTS